MDKNDKYNQMEGLDTDFTSLFQETSGDDDTMDFPAEHSDFSVRTVFTDLRRCVTRSHKCDECPLKGADDCKMVLLKQASMALMFMMAQLQLLGETIDHNCTDDDTDNTEES